MNPEERSRAMSLADLLKKFGHFEEAAEADRRALSLVANEPERRFLEANRALAEEDLKGPQVIRKPFGHALKRADPVRHLKFGITRSEGAEVGCGRDGIADRRLSISDPMGVIGY